MGYPSLVQSGDGVVTSEPRPSATVCVLHQGDPGMSVLMVRRSASARFMAGAWVFPGGVVDPEDHTAAAAAAIAGLEPGSTLTPWLAAGFREVVEETGIWLTDPPVVAPVGAGSVYAEAARGGRRFAAHKAAYFANWITPTMVPVRFDARFFIVAIDELVTPEPDQIEIDAAEFVAPGEALRRAAESEWLVPFPTQRTLGVLAEFPTVAAALAEWRQRTVVPVQPRMKVGEDGSLAVVMPDEPGFDHLEDAEPDPDLLARAARVAAEQGKPIAEVPDDRS